MTNINALNMREVYKQAIQELAMPAPSIPLGDWSRWNEMTGGFRVREFTIFCGPTGCLAGSTRIRVNRNSKGFEISIQEMYEQWAGIAKNNSWDLSEPTYVRSFNGIGIGLHKVKDVMLSGVKETVRLRTKQGHEIRLTKCHRVLTERGWVPAGQLLPTDRIAADTLKPRKTTTQKRRIRDSYHGGVRFHPYATNCKGDRRIVLHRAVYEAELNGLSMDQYLRILREDPEQAKGLSFINPKEFHVHHRNHDHYDNRIENLQLLSVADHMKLHGNAERFGAGQVAWVPILGVDKPGIEPVFDIECEDPHHNFVANGLVVHNSGKTTFLANLSAQLLKQGTKHFVMSVETGHTDFMKRVISVLAGKDVNDGKAVPAEELARIHVDNKRYLESDVIEFSLYENRVPVSQLKADLNYMVKQRGCKIAMIDNLNFFMEVTSSNDQILEMDRVIHELIILCKQLDVHIIMVMHPKKTDGGRVESEFDIKGSSTAVQEAHNVFLFNRPHPEAIARGRMHPQMRELKLAKMRRRGGYVGHSIVFESQGTKYIEKGFV